MMNTMHKNNKSSFALHFIIISFWNIGSRADTYLVEIFSQPHWTNVELGLMLQVEQDIFLPKPRDHETFQNFASSNLGGFHSLSNMVHLGKYQYLLWGLICVYF